MAKSSDGTAPPSPAPTKNVVNPEAVTPAWSAAGLDLLIILAFLTVAFLLGIFPLNDTDFWWHLRTGDLIRQSGKIPHVDPYLFGGPKDKPWIDLHWGFQVLISLGHELGGIDLLNLAKAFLITLAIAILILARPRHWPMEVMTLAGLPALLLLGGRMYVRPEILSLIYLAITFVLISNWRNRPWLALFWPLVMALWVNSHALFVLGLIVMACGLLDAATLPDAWSPSRRKWWGTVAVGVVLGGLACLLNPYGISGALFPLKLLGTMSNPIFADSIAELESVPHFLARAGWHNPNMLLLMGTQILGALSFLVPIVWNSLGSFKKPFEPEESVAEKTKPKARSRNKAAEPAVEKKRVKKQDVIAGPGWRPSVFRLLLFMIFTLLSWRATRNSQQFAAIAIAVTAWNLGEWVGYLRTRRAIRDGLKGIESRPTGFLGKFLALGVLVTACVLIPSGFFYRWLGEGRQFGLGEQPLWFAHEATIAAGADDMPDRFVCFHNGVSALWDYHNGPQKQNFADARLEVIGPDLYREYLDLQSRLARNKDWNSWFERNGRPGLLLDLVQESSAAPVANALAHPDWRCVWFDAMAAVFVHRESKAAHRAINFADRHFHRIFRKQDTGEFAGLQAEAKAAQDVAMNLLGPVVDVDGTMLRAPRRDLAAGLLLYAHGLAHDALLANAHPANVWKSLAMIASLRNGAIAADPTGRYRKPYDPLVDLERLRAVAAFRKSLEDNPDGFTVLFTLASLFREGKMAEAAIPLYEHLGELSPINATQRGVQASLPQVLASLRSQVGTTKPGNWKNLSELDQQVNGLLDHGQVETAANLLESAYPREGRPWEVSNRIGTLRLHLGDPVGARKAWSEAPDSPRPALQKTRVALTYLLEERYEQARTLLQESLEIEPAFFEALYTLGVLEVDDGYGHRDEAVSLVTRAMQVAPGAAAQSALRELQALLNSGEAGSTTNP